jgi:uncharacterized membrane protein
MITEDCRSQGYENPRRPREDVGVTIVRSTVLIASTLTVGLMAGLFYAFFYAIMPGLRTTDDRTFVLTMQRINVAILNGWFLICFVGALVLMAAAAALHFPAAHRAVLPWVVAALLLYLVMFGVTMGINVPLNNQLDAAGHPDRIADLAAVRSHFEAGWVRWNVVRAITSTASFGCLLWALVLSARSA